MTARATRNVAADEVCFAEGHEWVGGSSYMQGDWSSCARCGLYVNGRQLFVDDEYTDGAIRRLSNQTVERDCISGHVIATYEPQAITAELEQDQLAA